MNNCSVVGLDFVQGSYLGTDCNPVENDSNNITTKYYLNLSKLNYTVFEPATSRRHLFICTYDKNYKMISRRDILPTELGTFFIDLDPNVYTKISYSRAAFENLKGFQCNVGIGSMSNELAFGSTSFLDSISTLIPFVIILIGFGLGFALLKKLIKKSSGGQPV